MSDYKGRRNIVNDAATLRDIKKIEAVKEKFDLNNPEDVKKISALLSSGKLKFETKLGQDFDDEVYELNTAKEINNTSKGAKKRENKNEIKRLEDYDEEMQKRISEEMQKSARRRSLLIKCLITISVFCVLYFAIYYIFAGKSENNMNKLSELVGDDVLDDGEDIKVYAKLTDDSVAEKTVLDKYKTLYKKNKKLIGWIKIDDTNIDYPVMQCDNNMYYLNHNFDQEEDKAGCIFLDCECNAITGCDNYILYGHHLKSGKMFSNLSSYESEDFYRKHPYVTFDTIYEEGTYQVMYAFRSRVYNEEDTVFKYYEFINANSAEEFNSNMIQMAEDSFYDTGVTAYYGEQLLTLSTCDYNEDNGRFVVVCKKIK